MAGENWLSLKQSSKKHQKTKPKQKTYGSKQAIVQKAQFEKRLLLDSD